MLKKFEKALQQRCRNRSGKPEAVSASASGSVLDGLCGNKTT
jgi:hypothetical protein